MLPLFRERQGGQCGEAVVSWRERSRRGVGRWCVDVLVGRWGSE